MGKKGVTGRSIFLILLILPTLLFSEVDIDLGGDFIAEYRWDSREIYPNNSFNLLRARPKLEAEIDEDIEIDIATEIGEGVLELKDAKIEWEYDRYLGLGAGRRRKPFGLDNIVGLWDGPSLSYSELHGTADDAGYLSRDIGFWVFGKAFQEPFQMEYDLGAYNGHDGNAITSEKQISGRLIFSPHDVVDITGSYGTGLDTLGLKWRSGWSVGGIFDNERIAGAAEYMAGKDIVTEQDIEGWQLWFKLALGRFTPSIQYERSRRGDKDWEKTRLHIGTSYMLREEIKLRIQASQLDDKDTESHTELSISVAAKF